MCLGIPAKVTSIDGKTAKVEINGVTTVAALHLIENIEVGDYVLLHTGFIIQKLSREEAEETKQIIREIQQFGEGDESAHEK